MQANDASQVYLVFDWETRSQVDLKVLGQTEYARDASTEIMCCAFRLGTRVELAKVPTACWSPLLPNWQRSAAYMKFMDALLNPKVMLCAHNAGFEKSICLYVLADRLLREHRLLRSLLEPPQRWVCTAALAAALALPRSLEGAGTSLGLKIQKSMEGRKLLLKMCKPRRISKKNPEGGWHDSLDNLRDLQAYCMTDVDVETDLLLKLPPLNAIERAVWELDQVINTRGVEIDIELVDAVLQMVAVETENLNAETLEITGTVTSTTKIAQLQAWLSDHGCFLPDMTAGTVKDAISSGLAQGDALRLLEIRQQVGKSSVKKYPAFKACGASGRVRDTLMYHAASTGRWGGLRFQLHNLPRPVIKNTNFACEVVKEGDLEMVRLLYGDPINVFSDCLRGVLIAKWGHELYCADFAAIETRVLFWLAGHEDGLQAYRDGRDLYKEMARGIYSVPVSQVTDTQRQLGKKAILGCGYGMGHKRFRESCLEDAQSPMGISEELAKRAVQVYRDAHAYVPVFWKNLEKAAFAAIASPGKRYTINKTSWWVGGRFLWCQLPSGRRLAYASPMVRYEIPSWGGTEKRPVLYYWGANATTKQWGVERNWGGGLVENVVQAMARDLMAEAMLRLEAAGYPVVLTVHDEIMAERKKHSGGSLAEFKALMEVVPIWSPGMPIKVSGFVDVRYHK